MSPAAVLVIEFTSSLNDGATWSTSSSNFLIVVMGSLSPLPVLACSR